MTLFHAIYYAVLALLMPACMTDDTMRPQEQIGSALRLGKD